MPFVRAFACHSTVLVVAVVLMCGRACADDRLEAGKAAARSWGCFECHGVSGNDRSTQEFPVPMLAGQPEAFIAGRLKSYRALERPKDVYWTRMRTYAIGLSDEDVALIAAWYAAQKRY